MLKVDEKYCRKCNKYTSHNYVGSKGDFEGCGVSRGILAIASLGISETLCREKYWQCSKCGAVTKN